MRIINSVREMAEASRKFREDGLTVGLVPTMGSLHDGHLSLVRLARKENSVNVLSIFVNPAQFGPGEDLDRYPRDLEGDTAKCRREDVDVVFAPDPADVYSPGFGTYVDVEGVSGVLCGASRPGHFRGVATVVSKLFNMVRPHRAYFGQKDYQQTVVIRKMVKDLDMDVEVAVGPTVREPDGLAMSSRNAYLKPDERMAATKIYRALASAKSMRESGETAADALLNKVRDMLREEQTLRLEYASLVDPDDLHELKNAVGKSVLAVAVRVGSTRLIDNIVI